MTFLASKENHIAMSQVAVDNENDTVSNNTEGISILYLDASCLNFDIIRNYIKIKQLSHSYDLHCRNRRGRSDSKKNNTFIKNYYSKSE